MKGKLLRLKDRIVDNYKTEKKKFFIILAIWIIAIILTLMYFSPTLGMLSKGNDYGNSVVEINKNNTIEQKIKIEKGAKSLSLKFATYARNNKGNISVIVKDTNNNTIVDKTIDVNLVQDNAFYTYDLKKEIENDLDVVISISSNSEAGKGIGIYVNEDQATEDQIYKLNDKDRNGVLTYKVLYPNMILEKFNNGVLLFSTLSLTFIIVLILLIKPKHEVIFLFLTATLGLIFIIIITPFSPPDEALHYQYTLQLTNCAYGKGFDAEVDEAYIDFNSYAVQFNDKKAYIEICETFNSPLELKDKEIWYDVDLKEAPYIVYYIPQAIGLSIGRLLNLNFIKSFYLGRITNLIFYCVCIYLSIKKTPILKTMFGIISCLPILIQQAASYSYDCFVNGLCLLLISYLLNWLFVDKKIEIKEYVFVFLVCLAIAPAKYIYGPLSFLFWFVPSSRFGNKKIKILMVSLLCVPVSYKLFPLIYTRLAWIMRHIKEAIENTKTVQISKDVQLSYVKIGEFFHNENEYVFNQEERKLFSINYAFRHIPETINIIYTTIRFGLKTWYFGAIGRYLSGLNLILPLNISKLLTLIIVLSSLLKEEYLLKISHKISFIIMCIFVGLLSLAGMLLGWTHIGDTMIQGIQGRYYCPLLPFMFSTLNNKRICINKKYSNYILCAFILLMFIIIVYVLSYTFVN